MAETVETANPSQEAGSAVQATESSDPFAWMEGGSEQGAESEQNPEPTEEAQGEQTAGAEATEQETQEATEEEGDDWLPTEQEKQFPDDVLAKYAKRYGRTMEQLQADPQLRQLVIDKINSDIRLKQISEAEAASAQEEPTPEDDAEEPAEEPTPAQPAEAQQRYDQFVDSLVTSSFDPKRIEALGLNLLEGFGVDLKSQAPEVQALVKNAPKVGQTLSRALADGVVTMLHNPQVLLSAVESVMPGFSARYDRAVYGEQWEELRQAADDRGQPKYPNLSKLEYGSKDFRAELRRAANDIPGFKSIVFRDEKTGQPLPKYEQSRLKYQMLAQHLSGQRVDVKAVQEAVETGKKVQKDADRRRVQGKAFGAGQSTNRLAAGGQDDFKSMIAEFNASQRSTPIRD